MSFAILLLLVLMHLLLLRANKETDFLPGVPTNSQTLNILKIWCHSSLRSLLIESTVPFLVVLLSQVQIHHFRLGNMVDTYESHVLPFAAEAL